jgi:hypothetical protein
MVAPAMVVASFAVPAQVTNGSCSTKPPPGLPPLGPLVWRILLAAKHEPSRILGRWR